MTATNRYEVMVRSLEHRQQCLYFYRMANDSAKRALANKLGYATLAMGLMETYYMLDSL